MTDYLTFETPFPWCKTEFAVSPSGVEGAHATIAIRTGACTLQTYATRAELRRLGELLLRHANENETLEVTA